MVQVREGLSLSLSLSLSLPPPLPLRTSIAIDYMNSLVWCRSGPGEGLSIFHLHLMLVSASVVVTDVVVTGVRHPAPMPRGHGGAHVVWCDLCRVVTGVHHPVPAHVVWCDLCST